MQKYVYTCTQAHALAVQQVFKFWLVSTYCISYKCAPSGLYVYIRLTLACVIIHIQCLSVNACESVC